MAAVLDDEWAGFEPVAVEPAEDEWSGFEPVEADWTGVVESSARLGKHMLFEGAGAGQRALGEAAVTGGMRALERADQIEDEPTWQGPTAGYQRFARGMLPQSGAGLSALRDRSIRQIEQGLEHSEQGAQVAAQARREQEAERLAVPTDDQGTTLFGLVDGSLKSNVRDAGASAVGFMGPSLAAGMVAGPVVGLGTLFAQSTATKYDQLRAEGASAEEATSRAYYNGFTETLPETLPFGILFKKGMPYVKRVIASTFAEGASEIVTQVAQEAEEYYHKNPEATWGEVAEYLSSPEVLRKYAKAGFQGALMGGPMGAVTGGVDGMRGGSAETSDQANDADTLYERMAEKGRQRADQKAQPNAAQSDVGQAAAGEPVQTLADQWRETYGEDGPPAPHPYELGQGGGMQPARPEQAHPDIRRPEPAAGLGEFADATSEPGVYTRAPGRGAVEGLSTTPLDATLEDQEGVVFDLSKADTSLGVDAERSPDRDRVYGLSTTPIEEQPAVGLGSLVTGESDARARAVQQAAGAAVDQRLAMQQAAAMGAPQPVPPGPPGPLPGPQVDELGTPEEIEAAPAPFPEPIDEAEEIPWEAAEQIEATTPEWAPPPQPAAVPEAEELAAEEVEVVGLGDMAPDPVLKFGKHKGESIHDLVENDPDYVRWLQGQAGWLKRKHPNLIADLNAALEGMGLETIEDAARTAQAEADAKANAEAQGRADAAAATKWISDVLDAQAEFSGFAADMALQLERGKAWDEFTPNQQAAMRKVWAKATSDNARVGSSQYKDAVAEFDRRLDEMLPLADAVDVDSINWTMPPGAPGVARKQDLADLDQQSQAAEKISDFGEKIGGARKDTSVSTGPKPKTGNEGRGWRARYKVGQFGEGEKIGISNQDVAGKWYIEDTRKKRGWPYIMDAGNVRVFDTEAEAERAVALYEVSRTHSVGPKNNSYTNPDEWEIRRKVTDRKRVAVKGGFATRDEAMRYMAENPEEIIEIKTAFGGEARINTPDPNRSGTDWRQGRPATGQMFMDTFGFRGVEFGNWNNQAERQLLLDHAYDALSDLADLLGVPPRALSLNGDLALAFGARGHGKGSGAAHYEPGRGVINLTKMQGAGALAHEWMHALDHYFARQDGKAKQPTRNEAGELVFPSQSSKAYTYQSHGASLRDSGMREALRERWRDLLQTMFSKSVEYVEDTTAVAKVSARTEKQLEDALDDIRKELSEQKNPDYWKRHNKPATAEQMARFESLADALRRGEGMERIYVAPPKGARRSALGRESTETLEGISQLLKAVRNRAGWDSRNQQGPMDYLRRSYRSHADAVARVTEAEAETAKTRRAATDFLSEAKEIDRGRVSDYWSTEHEMMARAFEAYIQDRVSTSENASDFLAYGTTPADNALLKMMTGGKPYPEGQERQAINEAFDAFWQEAKTHTDDSGRVALFASEQTVPQSYARPGTGAVLRDIKQAVARTLLDYESAPDVQVVQSVSDLPQAVQDQIGEGQKIMGVYWRGQVYLVADNLRNGAHARKILAHEVVGHLSLEQMLGVEGMAELTRRIGLLKDAGDARVLELAERVAVSHGQLDAADEAAEIMALIAEERVDEPALRAVLRWLREQFRTFLRAAGLHTTYSPTDLDILISRAGARLRRGAQAGTGGTAVARFKSAVQVMRGGESMRRYGLNPKKRYTVRQVAEALEARQHRILGEPIAPTDYSSDAEARIARWMGEELRFELESNALEDTGVGWYSAKFQNALDSLAARFPEFTGTLDKSLPGLARLRHSQDARDFFTAVLAITSDGQKARDNFRHAARLYAQFRDTGTLPTAPAEVTFGNDRNTSIRINLAHINRMMDDMGPSAFRGELLERNTVRAMRAQMRVAGEKWNTPYEGHIELPMAAMIFGPKLGAFYANLMGEQGYLTMDRWWSRTFNRYRGTLLPSVSGLADDPVDSKGRPKGLQRYKQIIGNPDLSDEAALELVRIDRQSYEAKGFKEPTDREAAANTIWKAYRLEISDTPLTAGERSFMLRVANRARYNLKRATGRDITIADLQAILWYYEKKLYGQLGARDSGVVSYEDIARQVAQEGRGAAAERRGQPDADPGREAVSSRDDAGPSLNVEETREEEVDRARFASSRTGGSPPTKTRTAYKLFRIKRSHPGELFPLFVGANESVAIGEWRQAEPGEVITDGNEQGKVKSKLGGLAYRPGWHAGDLPIATHIGGRDKGAKAPTYRKADEVWAEVEVGDDVDWQAEADARATRTKAGKIVPRTAHITDQVPVGGHYRYKTNPNMTGQWIISGEMRVKRVLSDEEVAAINEAAGVADLPRREASLWDAMDMESAANNKARFAAAYHGTPHTWEPEPGFPHGRPRYDASTAMTGEGHQAYGAGFYVAENKAVAARYRTALAGSESVRLGGKNVDWASEAPDSPEYTAGYVLQTNGGSVSEAIAKIEGDLLSYERMPDRMRRRSEHRIAVLRDARNLLQSGAELVPRGNLYGMDVPDSAVEAMLDWDRLMKDQPKAVREALREAIEVSPEVEATDWNSGSTPARLARYLDADMQMTGKDVYQALANAYGSQEMASAALHAVGVPGIKYLDAGSRGDGRAEGTRNFVLFRPQDYVTDVARFAAAQRTLANPPTVAGVPLPPGTAVPTGATPGRNYTQDQLDALQNIDPYVRPRTLAERIGITRENVREWLIQGAIDQFRPLRRLGERAWMLARLTRAVSGAVEASFTKGRVFVDADGAIDINPDEQSLIDVLAPLGDEMYDFLAWIVGNRAESLAADGRENLFDPRMRQGLMGLNQGQMADGRDRASVYEQARLDLKAWQAAHLDIAEQAGIIDPAERAIWNEDFYVPFYRLMPTPDGGTRGPMSLSDAGLVGQTAFRRLKGGTEPLGDPLTNLLLNANHLLQASMNNRAANEALELAISQGVAQAVLTEDQLRAMAQHHGVQVLGRLGVPIQGTRAQVVAALKQAGVLPMDYDETLDPNGRDVVWTRRAGERHYYHVNDHLVMTAITALNYDGLNNPAMKGIRAFKRVFTQGVTAAPEFRIANLIRDSLQAVATSELSMWAPGNIAQGFAQLGFWTEKNSALRARMLASGAEMHFGQFYNSGEPDVARNLIARSMRKAGFDNVLDSPNALQQFVTGPLRRGLDWWEEFGSRVENVNRAALYEQLRAKGASHLEASFAARDLMDFSQHGAWLGIRFLTQAVPFLNARVQGMDKLGRSAVNQNQRGKFWAVTGLVTLASMLLYAAQHDEDWYRQREEWDRDTYWAFRIPGTDTIIRVPKPFEVGAMATIGERILQQVIDDEAHGKLFAERVVHILGEQLNLFAMPQFVAPALEVWANRDPFRGTSIESPYMRNLSPDRRRKHWTSETAIGLAKAYNTIAWKDVELSPIQVEYLINGYFGWAGRTALDISDAIYRGGANLAGVGVAKPDWRIEDYPVIGRFVRDIDPPRGTRYEETYYDWLQEVRTLYADLQDMRKLKEYDDARAFRQDAGKRLAYRKSLERTSRELSKLRQATVKIHVHPTMGGSEKRRRLDELERRRQAILERAYRRAGAAFTGRPREAFLRQAS